MIEKTFDLSTLNLSAGEYEITVKARAIGYGDSEPSNAVNYVVASEEKYTVSGTWCFNKVIYQYNMPSEVMYNIRFTSNGVYYLSIRHDTGALYFGDSDVAQMGGYTQIDGTLDSWVTTKLNNTAYRTITFDGVQTVNKEFYDWFTENAVQQKLLFTIGGITYYADPGMTWRQWVNSSYNTSGKYVIDDSDGSIKNKEYTGIGTWVAYSWSGIYVYADEVIVAWNYVDSK